MDTLCAGNMSCDLSLVYVRYLVGLVFAQFTFSLNIDQCGSTTIDIFIAKFVCLSVSGDEMNLFL